MLPKRSRHARKSDQTAEDLGRTSAQLVVSCRAHCQYGGKGDFKRIWIDLQSDGVLNLRTDEGAGPTRCINSFACTVASPKSSRKGHPHAFRLDLQQKDRALAKADAKTTVTKFIFSVESDMLRRQWMEAITGHSKMDPSKSAMMNETWIRFEGGWMNIFARDGTMLVEPLLQDGGGATLADLIAVQSFSESRMGSDSSDRTSRAGSGSTDSRSGSLSSSRSGSLSGNTPYSANGANSLGRLDEAGEQYGGANAGSSGVREAPRVSFGGMQGGPGGDGGQKLGSPSSGRFSASVDILSASVDIAGGRRVRRQTEAVMPAMRGEPGGECLVVHAANMNCPPT